MEFKDTENFFNLMYKYITAFSAFQSYDQVESRSGFI